MSSTVHQPARKLVSDKLAPGRLADSAPIAIIDIGSNSVRLVVYEGLWRNPTPIFNEKLLAGLGRGLAVNGELDQRGTARALNAFRRFRVILDQLRVIHVHAVATAAARDASNGPAFIAQAQSILRCDVEVLTGEQEARLSGLGVICGFNDADGIVGDLGGGSLELIDVADNDTGDGASLPVGVLRLADRSAGNLRKVSTIIADQLMECPLTREMGGRNLYCVGGTFRALASLHMAQAGYALNVMHHYQIAASEARDFAAIVMRSSPSALVGIEQISNDRRKLLPIGAALLKQLIEYGQPRSLVISALGVREGLLYSLLPTEERIQDPLLTAAAQLATLRSRSPAHAHELCEWTDRLFSNPFFGERPAEKKLRHAACLLADIGWRAHPDYRSEQSLNIIANAGFVGIDHPGRAFLALAIYYRYVGLADDHLSPRIREIATSRLLHNARLLGACLRVAYLLSASAPGIIGRIGLKINSGQLELTLPADLAGLNGERLENRLKSLAKLINRKGLISITT